MTTSDSELHVGIPDAVRARALSAAETAASFPVNSRERMEALMILGTVLDTLSDFGVPVDALLALSTETDAVLSPSYQQTPPS